MKYIVKIIIIFLIVIFINPITAFAQEADPLFVLDYVATGGGYADADQFSMAKLIGNVISSLLSLLGIIFVVLMIYGGFKWMKASGREDEVKKAQDVIKQAIIGLIITASSYAIYQFVMSGLLS